jgi:AcrR family transcriptional regulator
MTSAASLDTRTRILDTALELFSEHGFDGTTLQQIADRLGFTKAALYYHFRSKDALLQATVTPAIAGLEELLNAHEGLPDSPAQRRRFMEDYLDHLLCHRRLIAYMVSDLAIVAHPLIAIGSADRRARMQSMLAGDGLDFHDQVCVTMAFRGSGGVIAQYPDADTAELREALLDAARALLRPARRRPPQRTAPRRQARRPHPVGGS